MGEGCCVGEGGGELMLRLRRMRGRSGRLRRSDRRLRRRRRKMMRGGLRRGTGMPVLMTPCPARLS